MAIIHNLGMPRMGAKRELKFALEQHWKGQQTAEQLQQRAAQLRVQNWQAQQSLDWVPVGDFSLYDHVLDLSFMLGNVPSRAVAHPGTALDAYFRVARGRSAVDKGTSGVAAGEMTKWFDTNYHYIVPELYEDSTFVLNATRLLQHLQEAKRAGTKSKPVLVGPVTYLWLAKAKDGSDRVKLLSRLLPVYQQLLHGLKQEGVECLLPDYGPARRFPADRGLDTRSRFPA